MNLTKIMALASRAVPVIVHLAIAAPVVIAALKPAIAAAKAPPRPG